MSRAALTSLIIGNYQDPFSPIDVLSKLTGLVSLDLCASWVRDLVDGDFLFGVLSHACPLLQTVNVSGWKTVTNDGYKLSHYFILHKPTSFFICVKGGNI